MPCASSGRRQEAAGEETRKSRHHVPAGPALPTRSVFERLRAVLHEGAIDKRVQFIIEGLFAVRKAGFEASGHKAVPQALDLVESGGCWFGC